jgi:hypothetical protein
VNKDPGIRFRIKGRVTEVDQKINLLIQIAIGHVSAKENKSSFSIASDMVTINQHARRIFQGLLEVLIVKKDYLSLVNCISLMQSFENKVWESADYQTIQLDGIGFQLAQALAKAGIRKVSDVLSASPRDIERVIYLTRL